MLHTRRQMTSIAPGCVVITSCITCCIAMSYKTYDKDLRNLRNLVMFGRDVRNIISVPLFSSPVHLYIAINMCVTMVLYWLLLGYNANAYATTLADVKGNHKQVCVCNQIGWFTCVRYVQEELFAILQKLMVTG